MDTQRSKFYWGDINHGYFVDKYIDENEKEWYYAISDHVSLGSSTGPGGSGRMAE